MATMGWMATRPGSDVPSLTRNLTFCFVLMGIMGAGICVQLYRRSYRRKRSLISTLDSSRDISHVGPLIQSLRVQNTPVRNLAKHALITLLPTMMASDAAKIGLRVLVERGVSAPELQSALQKALGNVNAKRKLDTQEMKRWIALVQKGGEDLLHFKIVLNQQNMGERQAHK